jgi:hypothetical protein
MGARRCVLLAATARGSPEQFQAYAHTKFGQSFPEAPGGRSTPLSGPPGALRDEPRRRLAHERCRYSADESADRGRQGDSRCHCDFGRGGDRADHGASQGRPTANALSTGATLQGGLMTGPRQLTGAEVPRPCTTASVAHAWALAPAGLDGTATTARPARSMSATSSGTASNSTASCATAACRQRCCGSLRPVAERAARPAARTAPRPDPSALPGGRPRRRRSGPTAGSCCHRSPRRAAGPAARTAPRPDPSAPPGGRPRRRCSGPTAGSPCQRSPSTAVGVPFNDKKHAKVATAVHGRFPPEHRVTR